MHIGVVPRLELILEVISDVENIVRDCRFSFKRVFSSYLYAPYNDNLFYFTKLLPEGSLIITTKFDLCIEKAYEPFFNSKVSLIPKNQAGAVVYYSKNNPNTGDMDIHDTVMDIDTLGSTIRKVQEGLVLDLQLHLDYLFANNSTGIFLGNGFSDAFDVNPYFKSKGDVHAG